MSHPQRALGWEWIDALVEASFPLNQYLLFPQHLPGDRGREIGGSLLLMHRDSVTQITHKPEIIIYRLVLRYLHLFLA